MTEPFLPEESILLQALEIASPAGRAAFLDCACGENRHLRAEVEALLRAHAQSGDLLDLPEKPAVTVDEPSRERPGTVIGPYKLLQVIGEGGMGTVFMAEQTHPVQRRVALKVIKAGLDSRQVVTRFEAERQALAMMDHVNIARVLDAGATESGRPYFVMELVHGVPITKYCDDNHLTPRERLELFVPVCQAIQHAHQKGIIHRDIKPSNVMITLYDGKAVPKVIDFGVAKAIEQKLTERTLFTQYGTMVGTLEYMSPEQAQMSALGVDTRSDIFSLGVLLYELLTGSTPLSRKRIREAAYGEVLRMIKEEEPPKPSTRLSDSGEALASISAHRHMEPAKLTKLMRGELDWIVMKTLEKDRNRRYETAKDFAADVQRYLKDEPVQACPPSGMYRFRKFARRNKGPVLAASMVVLVLVNGIIGTTWGMLRASVAEADAVNETKQKVQALGEKNEALTTSDANYREAKKQEKLAKDSEKTAQAQELLARRRFYAAQMNLAMQAWEAGQPARVLELLESQRPRFDEEDLRAFEWYYLWRLSQGRHRFSLPSHNFDNARPLAYSPDGTNLASGHGKTVKIWDATTGRELHELHGHRGLIGFVAYAPDGKTLASRDGTGLDVKVWDVASGSERATFKLHRPFGSLAFTADGKSLLTTDDAVRLWNLTTIQEQVILRAEAGAWFEDAVIAPDGQTVVAIGQQFMAKILTRVGASWRERTAIFLGWPPCMALSPDGKVLAVGGGTLKLYDMATGKERLALQGHLSGVASVAFSAGGDLLASAGHDRMVRVWEVATGRQRTSLPHPGHVHAVALAPDGKRVAARCADAIQVWDVAPAEEPVLRHDGVGAVAFAPDGKTLVSLGSGVRKCWDPASGQEIAGLPAANIGGRRVAFSPDGKHLVTGGGPDYDVGPDYLELWDLAGRRQAVLQGHTGPVTCVAFSPDGQTVASASRDGSAIMWDLGTRRPRQTIKLGGWLRAVAFSPDGKTLAVGAQFGIVKLVDVATGTEIATPQRFVSANDGTSSVAFSPDGKQLVAGDSDGAVRLWNLGTGRLLASLKGHTDPVNCVSFSPDGQTVASACNDHTIKLWDVATGQERSTLRGHGAGVVSVVFAPDGKTLASGSRDGTVRLWRGLMDAEAQAYKGELDPDDPDSPVAANELGDRLWGDSRTDEVEGTYRHALARLERLATAFTGDPAYQKEMVRSCLSLSFLLAQAERPQEVEQARERAKELYAKLSPVEQEGLVFSWIERVRYGRAYNAEQAERTYSQALALAPENPWLWSTRGTFHRDLGHKEQAIADFSRAVELEPRNPDLWFARAYLYGASGQPEKAIADYSKVIDLEPKNWTAWNNRGAAWGGLGRLDKALAGYSKAIELQPDDARPWKHRGGTYVQLGQPDKALADFSKAIELKPDYAEAWNDRGAAHGRLKQIEKAIADYSEVIRLKPDFAPALHNRASMYAAQGKWDKASADFTKVVALVPTDAVEQNNLAWFLVTCPDPKFRDPSKAVKLAQKAVELAPNEGNHLNTLGVAHYRAGDWKAAVSALTKSDGLLKGNELSFNAFFLAMSHWQLGSKHEAHKWYDRAVQWMEKNKPQDEELGRFRAEAAELLGIGAKKD